MGILRAKASRWFGGLFLYGAAVHLLGLRMIARWEYPQVSLPEHVNRSFADHPLTNLGVAVFGGLFVALLMRRLIPPAAGDKRNLTRLLILSGLYGVLATELVLQAVFLSSGIFLFGREIQNAIHAPVAGAQHAVGWTTWLTMFGLAVFSIEIYGFGTMVQAIPFGLIYGISLGSVLVRFSRKLPLVLERGD